MNPLGNGWLARLWAPGVLVAIVLAAIWVQSVRHHVFARNFSAVEPGVLYRSGRLTPTALERVVKANGIRTIIDLGAYEEGSPRDRAETRAAEALGVDRYVLRLDGDGTGDPNRYLEALRLIDDEANQPVLVHCAAGAQRTSGCITLYRCIAVDTAWDFDDAYAEATNHGHDPGDNPQLRRFLEQWLNDIRDRFYRGGMIQGKGFQAIDPRPENERDASPNHEVGETDAAISNPTPDGQ